MDGGPPDDRADVARSRLALALCASAALLSALCHLAWAMGPAFPSSAASFGSMALPLGLAMSAAGAALLASRCLGRAAWPLGWVACAAFVGSLLARAVATGLSARGGPRHDPSAAMEAHAFALALDYLGKALLAVVGARIAARRAAWSAALGRVAVAAVVIAASTQIAQLDLPEGPWRVWLWGVPGVAAPVIVAATLTLAFVAAHAAVVQAPPRATGSADAVLALPLVLGARWACSIGAWFVTQAPDHGLVFARTALGLTVFGRLLAVLSVVCIARIGTGPARSQWAFAGFVLVACAEGASAFGFGEGAARVGLATGTACFLVGLAAIGSTQAETRNRAREAIGPFLVAAAATMPVPPVGPELRILLALIGLGGVAAGTAWLVATCLPLSKDLRAAEARGPEAVDGARVDEPEEVQVVAAATPVATSTGEVNPYAAPISATRRKRGQLGKRKLAPWRAELRRGIAWVIAPPVALGAAAVAIVLLGGVSGMEGGSGAGYAAAARDTALGMEPLFVLGTPLVNLLSLRGVFVVTQRAHVELPMLGGMLPQLCRLTMSLATAAQTAHAVMYFVYGYEPAIGVLPWAIVSGRVAYALCAFYGARLFDSAGHKVASLLVRALGFAFAVTASSYLLIRDGAWGLQVDAYILAALAIAAGVAGVVLRRLLEDVPRARAGQDESRVG